MACDALPKVTDDVQRSVDELSERLRREVIFHLLKQEFADYRQSIPDKETIAYEIEQIASLPCATKSLRGLFQDAREYRRDAGYYPAPATIADLKFVLSKRSFGAWCNRVRYGWLPKREDTDLRSLPSFKAFVTLYAPFVKAGLALPRPSTDRKCQKTNEQLLIGAVRDHICV